MEVWGRLKVAHYVSTRSNSPEHTPHVTIPRLTYGNKNLDGSEEGDKEERTPEQGP